MRVEGSSVDVQYSNWASFVRLNDEISSHRCVVVTADNYWLGFVCTTPQRYVCQS